MVTQKEIKESNREGVSMRKKMANLKNIYQGSDLDHTAHTPHTTTTHQNTQKTRKTQRKSKVKSKNIYC